MSISHSPIACACSLFSIQTFQTFSNSFPCCILVPSVSVSEQKPWTSVDVRLTCRNSMFLTIDVPRWLSAGLRWWQGNSWSGRCLRSNSACWLAITSCPSCSLGQRHMHALEKQAGRHCVVLLRLFEQWFCTEAPQIAELCYLQEPQEEMPQDELPDECSHEADTNTNNMLSRDRRLRNRARSRGGQKLRRVQRWWTAGLAGLCLASSRASEVPGPARKSSARAAYPRGSIFVMRRGLPPQRRGLSEP